MENLCHTLVGGALARAGLDRFTPYAMPALLVASNFPDIDVITVLWGDLAYLEHHRGLSHSVLGLLASAPLLALCFVAWHRIRHRGLTERISFFRLTAVCAVGLGGHLLLDWTNSYGVKPWLPFDDSWFYGDLVFIVDPWLWLVLGGALFLGASRRLALAAWAMLFVVLSGAVLAGGTHGPDLPGTSALVLWFVALACIVTAKLARVPVNRARFARVSLGMLVCYWLGLAAMHAVVMPKMDASAAAGQPVAIVAIPKLMRPDRWRGAILTPSTLYLGDVSAFDGPAQVLPVEIDRNLDDPAVVAAASTCPGQVATAFGRFLYARTSPTADGGWTVIFQDARFVSIQTAYSFATTEVELDAHLTARPDRRVCPRP